MLLAHLLADISSHGFGHLAQTAPILNELQNRQPDLKLTIRCGLPTEKLHERIHGAFTHIQSSSDFGFVMHDAVRIDAIATAALYRKWHANWLRRVEREAKKIEAINPDLVLTNVAYLPLAGAYLADIPCLSMSSLNWADLFIHFFGKERWAPKIHAEILASYACAKNFMCLTPSMPMRSFAKSTVIPPVATLVQNRRKELCKRIGCQEHEKLVLVAFGGFDIDVSATAWSNHPEVRWLIPQHWNIKRPDMIFLESTGFQFADLICSVDAVITKPGYGTFAEAACNGIPVLYLPRDDWPEQEYLVAWLKENARSSQISEKDLCSGHVYDALHTLWQKPAPPPIQANGANVAATYILEALAR